jgi:hypothetical protein
MEEQRNDNPPPETIARGYETMEFRLRWLGLFVVGIIVSAVVIHLIVWYAMQHFGKQTRAADLPQSAVKLTHELAAPSLQPTPTHDRLPAEDVVQMHGREDAIFDQLGWKRDADTGVFHPPADLIRAVANRTTAPATPQATGGVR